MIAGEALLDAFLNANILFFLGYALWLAVRGLMSVIGLGRAWSTQLRLLNAVFLTILAAPFIVLGYEMLQRAGVGPAVNMNLSDRFVAFYLNGGLEMKASDFEALIMMRDAFTMNVLNASGLLAQGAIALFALGVSLGLVRLGLSMVCLWRIVARGYGWRSIGRIRLRVSDATLVPFSTRGPRNYYVVIPSHLLGRGDALRVALAHEFQHIRQGDLEWEVVLESLKPLFFFNPAYRAWKRQVEQLRELRCDTAVLRAGRIGLRTYCDTLLSICQATLRRDRLFVQAVPKVTLVTADRDTLLPNRKRSFLEQRIEAALETRPQRHQRIIFAASAIPLLAALTLTTLAIQSPGDWSQDRLMLSTVVNLDRLQEINRLSAFGQIRQ